MAKTICGRIGLGIAIIVVALLLFSSVGYKCTMYVLNEYSNAAQAATTKDPDISQQFATNTAKTWKVAEKNVTREGLGVTYEFVLASGRDRIVIRKNMSVPESSDIIVGDTVRLSRTNYILGDAYNHPNDPIAYDIERVKTE